MVADRRGGADVVEVAHESLLRQWPPLTAWLQADADDLRVVDAVERAAGEWVRNGRLRPGSTTAPSGWPPPRGCVKREDFRQPLGRGQASPTSKPVARAKPFSGASDKRRCGATAAVFGVLAVLLLYEWRDTVRARKESEASLLIAQSGAYLSNLNVGAAIERARRAFQSVPSAASRSALLQAVMELSPSAHRRGAARRRHQPGAGMGERRYLDFATDPGRLRTFDFELNLRKSAGGFDLPVIKRSQDGNPSFVRAFSPIGAARNDRRL